MSQDFQVTNHLLRAIDRRDPWAAADLLGWLKEHYPEFLRSVEPEKLDAASLKRTDNVLRSAIAELRERSVSREALNGNLIFLGECRNDFGGMFPSHEIGAAVFALSVADQVYDDPAFPAIVRNLLDIAAECVEIELKSLDAKDPQKGQQ